MSESPPPFRRLGLAWFVLLDGPIVLLIVAACSERLRSRIGRRIPVLRPRVVRWLLAFTVVAHAGEAAAAGRNARRKGLRQTPWVIQTALVGAPSLKALSRVKAIGPGAPEARNTENSATIAH